MTCCTMVSYHISAQVESRSAVRNILYQTKANGRATLHCASVCGCAPWAALLPNVPATLIASHTSRYPLPDSYVAIPHPSPPPRATKHCRALAHTNHGPNLPHLTALLYARQRQQASPRPPAHCQLTTARVVTTPRAHSVQQCARAVRVLERDRSI